MRIGAALLAMVLVAPAHSSAPPRAPTSPRPVPTVRIAPPPVLVRDRRWESPPPSPAEIEAKQAPEFRKCAACHNLVQGSPNGMGPNLHGVFGRPAATQTGYVYSPALLASGLVWDDDTLDRWLASPRTLVPGSRMTFSGIRNPEERKAVIAFLRQRSAPRP